MEKLTIIVPEELSGHRLDVVLANLFPQHSRSRLQAWIKAGNVRVNNQILRQKDPVVTGQEIEIIPEYTPEDKCLAQEIPLEILFEDSELIVINKPAGLVVHPGAGNPDNTLQNALLHHDPELHRVARAGIFQRLDKDTSGIMVIARTPETHTRLVEQLQSRNITREYRAVVSGAMTAGGKIDAPVGRHQVYRKRMAVTEKGKPAITHYRILMKYRSHTHISVRLETGRTHQIRVHMAYIHHPVVGDPVYGGRKRLPKNICPELRHIIQSFPRQALHASSMSLSHPVSGQQITWESPLPEDIQELLDSLANYDA